MQLRIHPLPLLKFKTFKGKITHLVDVAEVVETYCYIWYIENAEKRILVDAGALAQTMVNRGASAEHIAHPSDALKKVGITPDKIDIVICTHLHNDHMELAKLYSNAEFIIQRKEVEANFNPHSFDLPRCVSKTMLDGINFRTVEGDTQVVNGVRVLLTPGHTRGGQSVEVDTVRGRVIISGLCTIRDNFVPTHVAGMEISVIPPAIHSDVYQAYDSLVRIKNEADIILPSHDVEYALGKAIP